MILNDFAVEIDFEESLYFEIVYLFHAEYILIIIWIKFGLHFYLKSGCNKDIVMKYFKNIETNENTVKIMVTAATVSIYQTVMNTLDTTKLYYMNKNFTHNRTRTGVKFHSMGMIASVKAKFSSWISLPFQKQSFPF